MEQKNSDLPEEVTEKVTEKVETAPESPAENKEKKQLGYPHRIGCGSCLPVPEAGSAPRADGGKTAAYRPDERQHCPVHADQRGPERADCSRGGLR